MCTVAIKKKNSTIKMNKILISGVDPATTIQKKTYIEKMHAGKESEMMLIIALESV